MSAEKLNCFLDSSVMVDWLYVPDENSSEWRIEKHREAVTLINQLRKDHFLLCLATPVLAEILSGFETAEEQNHVLKGLRKIFHIYSFDIASARICTELLSRDDIFRTLIRENKDLRDHIRTDSFIIATAISNNAACIYSRDGDFEKLAHGRVPIKKPSDIIYQASLTDE